MSYLLREVLLPPGCLLILMVLGLALLPRRPKVGQALLGLSSLLLYLLSIAPVSHRLTALVEKIPAVGPEQVEAFAPQAIVVLGGGAEPDPGEYPVAGVPSQSSLVRTTYAAFLARETGLPVLTSGGYGDTPEQSEAQAMAWALSNLGVTATWLEDQSRNTRQNAELSRKLTEDSDIERIILVTSASHIRRATAAFEKVGFHVLPAPTGFRYRTFYERGWYQFLPTANGFRESSEALRALLGELWYRLGGGG